MSRGGPATVLAGSDVWRAFWFVFGAVWGLAVAFALNPDNRNFVKAQIDDGALYLQIWIGGALASWPAIVVLIVVAYFALRSNIGLWLLIVGYVLGAVLGDIPSGDEMLRARYGSP